MGLGKHVTSKDSVQSDTTFDTLLEETDLESPNSGEDLSEGLESPGPQTPSKPVSLEDQNRLLALELEKARSEVEFWKSKVHGQEANKGIWEHTMNGLRQFVSTPPDKLSKSRPESPELSVEFTRKDSTGLFHRKPVAGGYSEKLKITPFKIQEEDSEDRRNSVNADKEEGVALVKCHASDHDESSLDSKEEDEPSFFHQLVDRGAWLVGLLVLQSFSSFIIQHNERLLQRHTVIVRFLTMLVGAGGNAGNQAR